MRDWQAAVLCRLRNARAEKFLQLPGLGSNQQPSGARVERLLTGPNRTYRDQPAGGHHATGAAQTAARMDATTSRIQAPAGAQVCQRTLEPWVWPLKRWSVVRTPASCSRAA